MAAPEIVYESILPSGRGIRFVACDTRRTLEITERAADHLPKGDKSSTILVTLEIQKETVASCVRGVTHRALEIKMKAAVGDQPPLPDLEATLAEWRDPSKNAWKALSYAQLTVDGEDHMLEVFKDIREWSAVQDRINAASRGGAVLDDPFRGLTSIRTG